jgi:hypothetical protein
MHVGIWWETAEIKKSLGRPSRRWKNNIKINLKDI